MIVCHRDLLGSQLWNIVAGLLFKAQKLFMLFKFIGSWRKCAFIFYGLIVWKEITALSAILASWTTLKSYFFMTLAEFSLYRAEKIEKDFQFHQYSHCHLFHHLNHLSFMWKLSLIGNHVTVCVPFKQTHGRSRECWADNQGTSCHS